MARRKGHPLSRKGDIDFDYRPKKVEKGKMISPYLDVIRPPKALHVPENTNRSFCLNGVGSHVHDI